MFLFIIILKKNKNMNHESIMIHHRSPVTGSRARATTQARLRGGLQWNMVEVWIFHVVVWLIEYPLVMTNIAMENGHL